MYTAINKVLDIQLYQSNRMKKYPQLSRSKKMLKTKWQNLPIEEKWQYFRSLVVRERLHFDGYFERTFVAQSEPCGFLLRQRRIQITRWFEINGFEISKYVLKTNLPNRRSNVGVNEIIGVQVPSKLKHSSVVSRE